MSYPTSSDVAAGQPTASAHYNTLRADALRFGEAAADSVNLGELFSRYEHNLRLQYLATNRLRVPGSVTVPVGIVINGIPLRSVANVDLAAGSAPSGAAATYYVFAIATAASTTFTIDVNTSSAEGTDQRLIGSFYWDGSAIVQDSIITSYGEFLESMAQIPRNPIVQGRITLATGNPVPSSDVGSTGTVYFTPYKGNKVSLYSPGRQKWVTHLFTEVSISLTGIATDKNVDVFLYDNAGTLTLSLVQWSNDTARATALAWQDGVYVRNGAPSYLYLGTVRTSGLGVSEDTQKKRFVYNYYNRVVRHGYNYDDGEHTYAAEDERIWNNVLADTCVGIVVGVAEDAVFMGFMAQLAVDTSSDASVFISDDGDVDDWIAWVTSESTVNIRYGGTYTANYPAGYHYYYLCETGNTTDNGGIFDYGEINILFPM